MDIDLNKHHGSDNDDDKKSHNQENMDDDIKMEPKPVKVISGAAKLLRFKQVFTKLQQTRQSFANCVAAVTSFENSNRNDARDLKLKVRETKADLKEFKKLCKQNSELVAESETNYNPHGSLFIGIKRKIPSQDEFSQAPLKVYRDVDEILKESDNNHSTLDTTLMHIKEKVKLAKILEKSVKEERKPLSDLNRIIESFTRKHRDLEIPAGAVLASDNISQTYQSIDFTIIGILKAVILLKDVPGVRRQILKITFFKQFESAGEENASDMLLFQQMTRLAIHQAPYPINVPTTFSPVYSDPLPYLFEYLRSFSDLYEAPCTECKKVLRFFPGPQPSFFPPFVRVYNREDDIFLPYHPACCK
ncbi:hypothetical protein K502DRAFT_324829 [Neoconidiobolus thromboides FSU 785]|nr:hypothetical protein K502DRAFT_324829 [Neoconidiobolus thromboides FSU 785]